MTSDLLKRQFTIPDDRSNRSQKLKTNCGYPKIVVNNWMEENQNSESDSSSFVQVGGSQGSLSPSSNLKKGKKGKSSRCSSKSGSSFHITGSEVESIVPDVQDAKSFEIQSYRSSEERVLDIHKYELGEEQKKDILSGIMKQFHFNEQP